MTIIPQQVDAAATAVFDKAVKELVRARDRGLWHFAGFDVGAGFPEDDVAGYVYQAYVELYDEDPDDDDGIAVTNEAIIRLDRMVRSIGHLEVLIRAVMAKEEIEQGIRDGAIPPTICEFRALHDICDANAFGGLCILEHGDDGLATMSLDDVVMMQGLVDLWLSRRKVRALTAVVYFDDQDDFYTDADWTESLEARLYALPIGGNEVESVSVITFGEDMIEWHDR